MYERVVEGLMYERVVEGLLHPIATSHYLFVEFSSLRLRRMTHICGTRFRLRHRINLVIDLLR